MDIRTDEPDNGKQVTPTDGMEIGEDCTLAPGVYYLPHGLSLVADGITFDGNGALLIGRDRRGTGLRLEGRSGVTIKNVRLRDYYHGIHASSGKDLTLIGNQITATAELPPNTVFLDIWRGPEEAYGGAILLWEVTDSLIAGNDLQHQQSGLLTYGCERLTVRSNQAGYNSGYGFHLFDTSDSLFEENHADYCCRFEPREGGRHYGHMGADAAGFLIVHRSCRNTFRRNTARLGGDGFFLAGLSPDGRKVGCDDNLFEENDASLSPNIAFEATFSRGNIFRNNFADRCNYGFWLGFSWDTTVENNRVILNRQAGIAVENGHGFTVRGNTFQANGHGILIWTKHVESFAALFPENGTSYDWNIEENTFTRNGKGIRIAADQDHGIRSLPAEASGKPETRPRDHAIRKNDIQDNRVGIELSNADNTLIEENILNRNVEANLRQDDTRETLARNNLGAVGGYL
ncbi:MAG TPA: right-handed parallel beta-helix repeat-containing protein [Chthonomonadaceae bacterium]|nr:right-handed parallel beta-helix repeat-containing protein [Chthonomonadaceae bacterium]